MCRYLQCDVGDETERSQHGVFNVSVQPAEVMAIKDRQEGGETKACHFSTTSKPQQVQTGLFTCTTRQGGNTVEVLTDTADIIDIEANKSIILKQLNIYMTQHPIHLKTKEDTKSTLGTLWHD